MKKVIAISSVLLGVVFLAGCGQQPVSQTQPTTPAPVVQAPAQSATKPNDVVGTKTYTDEKNGFEIQYPSYLSIEGNPTIESGNVILAKSGLSIMILVSDNKDGETLSQYYQSRKKDLNIKNLKQITSLSPAQNITESQQIAAVRYEFDAIPKQQAGGYTYVIIEKGKIFEITILSDDKSSQDSLLDDMMNTFKFTK